MEQPALSATSGTLIVQDQPYAERALAGRQLAKLLRAYHSTRALVLALPPGGVPIAIELARALHLPVDVLVVREIVVRPYPALIAGALSEGGGLCLNRALLRLPGVSLASFWREARRVQQELAALVALYHAAHPLPSLNRRAVIVVDDGLGNGLLQLAALEALRHAHVARCVVATPYGAPEALQQVGRHAASVVALTSGAEEKIDRVGHWRQAIGDAEAATLLAQYQCRSPASQSRDHNPQ